MHPSPFIDPSEVSRLSLRWLDGVATDAERDKLFEALAADASAALTFAQHARFEQLLTSASHDRARQAVVLAATERQQTRHQRRQVLWQAMKIAALVLFIGPLVWLAWPEPKSAQVAQIKSPATLSWPGHTTPAVVVSPPRPPESTTTPPISEAPPAASLEQRLTSFYLPPMKFEQVTLADALRQIEAQMKAINRNADSDLARLLMQMPASAAQQKITFDSPGMGVLPLVKTVAGLAGCEASLSPDSLHLVLNMSSHQLQRETRTYATVTTAEELANAEQFKKDADAVGIDTSDWEMNDQGQRLPPANINASTGQFKALDALGSARAALSQIPPVRLRALVVPRPPGAENRELTLRERDDYLAKSALTPSATFELKPGTPGVGLSTSVAPTPKAPIQIIVFPQSSAQPVTSTAPQIAMNTLSTPTITLRTVPAGTGQMVAFSTSSDASSTAGKASVVMNSNGFVGRALTAVSLTASNFTAQSFGAAMDASSAGAVLALGNGSSLVIVRDP